MITATGCAMTQAGDAQLNQTVWPRMKVNQSVTKFAFFLFQHWKWNVDKSKFMSLQVDCNQATQVSLGI